MGFCNFTDVFLQISSLQSQIHTQESDLQSQEEELNRAKADLGRLQQEENQLEQSLAAGKIQLETIIKSLKATQDEINQVGTGCTSHAHQQGSVLHCPGSTQHLRLVVSVDDSTIPSCSQEVKPFSIHV